MALEFRILGPLEAVRDGFPLPLGARRQRKLLAILLLRANEVVSTDRIFDGLYGESPPPTAASSLQNAVSKLRRALGADVIQTRAPGYAVELPPDTLDAVRFERLVTAAPADPVERSEQLRAGLALWRGPPLSDFAFEPFAQTEIARLEELRLSAVEERIEADLALGRHAVVVSEIGSLIAEQPFRERLRRQLMLALYGSGRQAEALEAYQQARRAFVDELGIEPSPALRELERAILRQDSSLAAVLVEPPRDEVVLPEPAERRQTVTVLFADVVHSTRLARALDPEALREVLARYFQTVRRVLDHHGGTVEKYVGDAVLAIFGVPRVHEDDALRAVRAATAIHEAMGDLNLNLAASWGVEIALRIGINTGEVVAGGSHQLLATGEAVHEAKRLEEAAGANETLVGEATWRLVRDAVEAERVQLSEEVEDLTSAWRLRGVTAARPFARRLETPIVDRGPELARLRHAFDQTVHDQRAHLVTILGVAGIGKTRLALEVASAVAGEATVLTGHCPAFGEALTYSPLLELVAQLGDRAADVRALLEDGRIEEIRPAVRALLEEIARERPLVVVLEDLHWAEPTFLDLVEYLAEWIGGAPVLLLCVARVELMEERPGWGGGKLNATSLLLEPLSPTESEALVLALLGAVPIDDAAQARVVETAEGNPLFVEQLLSSLLLGEAGELPSTIEALLAARLGRLGPGERAVVEVAAVVGREFTVGAVAELLPREADESVPRHVASLVRKELVRPVQPALGDEAFAFRHALVREAAYRSTPKARRAKLHGQLADRLRRNVPDQDELIGYHLEQAYSLRTELRPVDEKARRLAADAGERLARAGITMWKRGDVPAAVNLLGRATALLPASQRQRELLAELGLALRSAGEFEEAEEVLQRAVETSRGAGDRRVEHRARIELVAMQLATGPTTSADELLRATGEAIPVFEEAFDERSLGRAWLLAGYAEGALLCRNERWRSASERALHFYESSGWTPTTAIGSIAAALYHGPTPVPEAVEHCLSFVAARSDPLAEASVLTVVGALRALEGRFDDARRLLETSERTFAELGHRASVLTNVGWARAEVELAAADAARAEEVLRELCAGLEAMHAAGPLATEAAELAEVMYLQGRWEEALEWIQVSESNAARDDLSPRFLSGGVKAKVLARRGDVEAAETLAREAVALVEKTDSLNQHAKVLLDLGEVLRLAGRTNDAGTAIDAALALYERKANVVGAARARRRLGEVAVA